MPPKHKQSSSLVSLDGFKDLITLNRHRVNALIAKEPQAIDKPVSEGFLGALVRLISHGPSSDAGSPEWLKAARLLALIVRDRQDDVGTLYQGEQHALAPFKEVLAAPHDAYPPECRTVALRVVFRAPYGHRDEVVQWLVDRGWMELVAGVLVPAQEDGVVRAFALRAMGILVADNARALDKLREHKDWLEGVTDALFSISAESRQAMAKQFSLGDRTDPIKDGVTILCQARPSPFVVSSLSSAFETISASTSLETRATALHGLSEVVRTDRIKAPAGATSIHDLAIDACVIPLLLSMASTPQSSTKGDEKELLLGIKSHALGCLVVLTHQQRRITSALEQAIVQSNALAALESIEKDDELPADLREMATQVLARLQPNAPEAGSYVLALRRLP